jgi:hypothetical protein
MQEAFKAAGVKPKSLAERVWNFVKDNPNCTARTVEAIYGASAAQALSDMFGRDMLKRSSMPTRDRQGKMRNVWIYRVASDTYEPLPRLTKPKPRAKPDQASHPLAVGALPEASHPASVTATLAPSEPQKVNLTALVDGLTVAEARALYHQLKLMFG